MAQKSGNRFLILTPLLSYKVHRQANFQMTTHEIITTSTITPLEGEIDIIVGGMIFYSTDI